MRRIAVVRVSLVVAFAFVVCAACSETSRMRSRCLSGDISVCIELGDRYATGNRVERDMGRAAEMYQRACELGAANVCNTLGEIYERGDQIEGGTERAEQLFRLACNGSSPAGCLNLGLALVARDDKKAGAELFERSCSAGLPAACHHFALALQNGEGVLPDLNRAIAMYDDACADRFVESCLALGEIYLTGSAVPRDALRATRYYGSALKLYDERCGAGSASDCRERDKLRTRVAILAASQRP